MPGPHVPINNRSFGDKGEAFARAFLQEQGYRIIETNYRVKIGEIDIVAQDGDRLVFIEVKTRIEKGWDPFEAVHPRKQRTLYRVAEQYLLERHKTVEINGRFDVLAVHALPDGSFCGDLIKDAFPK